MRGDGGLTALGRTPWHRLGLRASVTAAFAVGATALAVVLAVGTYLVARGYLVETREDSATRQAFADASVVRDGLLTAGLPVSEVLGTASPPAGADVLLQRGGQWYSSSLALGSAAVPESLAQTVGDGGAGLAWTSTAQGPAVVVGVPLPAVRAEFYQVVVTEELQRTLDALRVVLTGFALLTAVGGALLGRWAAGRVVAPLHEVAGTAAVIAAGELDTRLATTDDPDLATIVGSFNSMVDALEERLARELRFTADVSHELRTPLTTLVTSVGLLERRREELPERSRRALDLVSGELERFARTLEDLLELGRLDAGVVGRVRTPVRVDDLVRSALEVSGRSPALLAAGGASGAVVAADKATLSRALVNLFDNADRHGGGVSAVSTSLMRAAGQEAGHVLVVVDDDGPGVEPGDRERIFERFARAGSRGSLPGSGLGLSLVQETVRAHGGAVSCTEAPGGGARFVVRLPLAPAEALTGSDAGSDAGQDADPSPAAAPGARA